MHKILVPHFHPCRTSTSPPDRPPSQHSPLPLHRQGRCSPTRPLYQLKTLAPQVDRLQLLSLDLLTKGPPCSHHPDPHLNHRLHLHPGQRPNTDLHQNLQLVDPMEAQF
ncbi:uncharacterized protein LOC115877050 [Sitophilus oryzae]|uniref:Uncharacterized protein LOC115877050 n=1 Tax=Sitophilus oryzae TaxID=7048 RepID=A0A6J2XDW5_SITOR|nr:uncharacterized protein LOC115877050 [Sitophilus oryzae]